MGMAIFAGTLKPTNNTAAEIIGNTASNAKIEGDIFLITRYELRSTNCRLN